MIDETIYQDYVNFQLENGEFVSELELKANDVYYRFSHVKLILEHLYNDLINQDVTNDTDTIVFETAYYYFFNQINDLKELLSKYFKNDFEKLNENAKAVNLLLNTYDFQTELGNVDVEESDNLKQLFEFDQKIIACFDEDKVVPENYYYELDTIVTTLYEEFEIEPNSLNLIFLEIAEELNII